MYSPGGTNAACETFARSVGADGWRSHRRGSLALVTLRHRLEDPSEPGDFRVVDGETFALGTLEPAIGAPRFTPHPAPTFYGRPCAVCNGTGKRSPVNRYGERLSPDPCYPCAGSGVERMAR